MACRQTTSRTTCGHCSRIEPSVTSFAMMNRRFGMVIAAFVGIVVAATAWAALTPVESTSREQVYVIAKGTFARRMAGENIDILPSEIHLTIGIKEVLVLQNDDDVPQLFGPVLIMPGQSFRLPFARPS